MKFRSAVLAAAAAVVMVGTAASATTTYIATSHYENDAPEHSVWFKNAPTGASGTKANHFLFENTIGEEAAFGKFVVDGNMATLTGTVRNAALQGYDLVMKLVEVGDPGVYKKPYGSDPDTSGWKFYDFVSAQLISKTEGIASLLLEMRGAGLKVQFGVGANDKDPELLGLSTWFTAYEGKCIEDECQKYYGDINIVLEEDDGSSGSIPLPAGLFLLPAAMGMLGAAGGMARRRRNS